LFKQITICLNKQLKHYFPMSSLGIHSFSLVQGLGCIVLYGLRYQHQHATNANKYVDVDVDVDGVYERRPKPLCPHLEITLR